MSNRALPDWMSKRDNPETDALKQVGSGFYKKNVIEDGLPYLEFTGTVVYSCEKNDCSFLTEDIRSTLTPNSVVGFDLEWPPCFIKGQTKKAALVQLCAFEDKCYLFHLSSMSGFPTGLKMFLEDESIRKVGVGIEGDKWKLLSDFDVNLKGYLELGKLANNTLRCQEKWSLDGLVKQLFKKRLVKQKDVRCSNWDDFDLSEEQKRYAATDAFAGLIIYNKLETLAPLSGPVGSVCGLRVKLCHMAKELEDLAIGLPEELNDIHRAAKLAEDMSDSLNSLTVLLLNNNNNNNNTTAASCTLAPDPVPPHEPSLSTEHRTNGTHAQDHGMPREDENLDDSNMDLLNAPQPHLSDIESCDSKVPEPGEEVCRAADLQRADPQSECIMSLDISEYELHLLERQARQEELEEQSTLEFKEQNGLDNSADLSYEVESDQELDSEMLQCVEEVERQSQEEKKTKHEDQREQEEEESPTGPEEEDEDIEEEEEEEFDPSIPEPNSEQIKCLKMYFGHSHFKPVQWKVIHSVLKERRDNLVVMATGYGKSLCFQYPPVYCGGISIVVCPLIALMEDQVLQLTMSNIPACFLGSAQTQNVFAELKAGHFKVVYMTPEYCSGNVSLLEDLNRSIGISLIAVDEAHCISEWGHDFRGAYRTLGSLKRGLPDVPIVALTATASPSIRDDIVRSLNLECPVITCTSFDRPNLFMDVNKKSGDMMQDLKTFLKKKKGGEYEFEGPAIIYCPARKVAERVTSALYKLGVSCGVYHAGLSIKQRKDTQYRFMRDEIQCMVATVAFGMGINKPDIRKVIHYGAPKEMESYYQEMGRAGRDGLPSACHVLWTHADMSLNRFLLNQVSNNRFRGYKLKMMFKMEQYLNSLKCRRKLILSHFEDKQLRKVTSGIMGTDQCCDNCHSGSVNRPSPEDSGGGRQDFGPLAYQLMGGVSAMGEKFGVTAPILFLRGSCSQKVPARYRGHPLFGAGKGVSEVCWKALAREMMMEDYLKESTGQSKFITLCKITPKGKQWFSQAQDERHRNLLLQPNTELTLRPSQTTTSTKTSTSDRQSSASTQIDPTSSYSRPGVSQVQRPVPSPVRPAARLLTQAEVSKPQPPPVSARELQLQTLLYAKLVSERQKLASDKDIPPAILATNKILLDMAKTRPCSVSSLKLVDGVSEAKSSMLAPLLQTIACFCEEHHLKVDCLPAPAPAPAPALPTVIVEGARPCPLPDSIALTYRLFQQEGKSMRQVCDTRSLPSHVVEFQLLQAYKANHPLDTERVGLNAALRNSITRAIQSYPSLSDLSDVKAIRARVPEDISTFLIQLTVAQLQRVGMPTAPPGGHSRLQQELIWIEPGDKPVRSQRAPVQPTPQRTSVRGLALQPAPQTSTKPDPQIYTHQVKTEFKPDPDEMEMSEDDLFRDLPMPEPAPRTSTKTDPQTYTHLVKTEFKSDPDELEMSEDDLFRDLPMPEPAPRTSTKTDPQTYTHLVKTEFKSDPDELEMSEDDLFRDLPMPEPAPQTSTKTDPQTYTHLVKTEFKSDPDELERSEDDLFRDLPMPEETGPSSSVKPCTLEPITAYKVPVPAPKAVPQSNAAKLASWNSQPLDEDTQELFFDASPQNVSQPAKRKLPDWAEAPRRSTSSAACTKKAKKKKGLFS